MHLGGFEYRGVQLQVVLLKLGQLCLNFLRVSSGRSLTARRISANVERSLGC
jgi:hypothetical protein